MARVRIYTNTGFNGIDIPDSISMLMHGDHELIEYNDVNIGSAENLQSIKVSNIDSADAATVDYIVVKDDNGLEVLYTNMGSKYIAPRTFEFILEPNCLPLILDDITIISAVAERMHVNDDDDIFYPNQEPFEATEPFNVGYTTFDSRFPNRGNPAVTNIVETITIPPAFTPLADNKDIGDGNKVTQRVYGPTQQFTNKNGPEYDYTNPQSAIITDSDGNVLQENIMMTMQPKFRSGAHTIIGLVAFGQFAEAANIDSGSYYWISGAQQVINDLKALGADSSVTNSWAVPTAYIGALSDGGYNQSGAAGGVSNIGNNAVLDFFEWGLPVAGVFKNNKVVYAQAVTTTVYNPVSGSSLTKQAYEVRNPEVKPSDIKTGGYICSFQISADIRPEGCPMFMWTNKNGNAVTGFPEVIEGGNWRRVPVSADTYSGSYWDRRQLAMQKNILNMSLAESYSAGNRGSKGLFDSVIDILLGNTFAGRLTQAAGYGSIYPQAIREFTGQTIGQLPSKLIPGSFGISSIGMQGLSFGQANRALELQEIELNARATVASPVISISTSNFLRDLGYNTFYGIVTSYSQNDLFAFDKFLTKYGYNVGNKKFEETDFWSRPHFNYVKLKSITMKSDRSLWIRNMAEQQLLRGVRIWHEYPNAGAIEDGNKQ